MNNIYRKIQYFPLTNKYLWDKAQDWLFPIYFNSKKMDESLYMLDNYTYHDIVTDITINGDKGYEGIQLVWNFEIAKNA